ncbi:unnamed protein product, partial [Porites evermanni]
MRHYLDPEKKGSKFEYTPPKPLPKPIEPKVRQPLPKPIPPVDPRPAKSDKDNLIQGKKEDTVTHRRSFSDRDQPKSELRHDLGKGTYGDIILLEAKVRYGKISYEDGDVLQRERGWRPSLKLEADVETDLKSYPVRTVTYYQTGDGSITYNAFYLFNCDETYNLEIVETFLLKLEEKYGFKITVDRRYFGLQEMADLCEKTLPQLVMDFAVFVIHADESRLSINEDNAGIGYARIYRALLEKTGNKVLIVIGGDSYYQNEDEEARSVISRWSKRKVASQFREEYLDGRQSFIFSWNKKHRPIHEQAMRHFLDPSKRGFKFECTLPRPLPKPIAPVVPQPSRKPEAPEVPRTATPYPTQEVGLTSLLHIPPPSLFSVLKKLGTAPAVYPAGTTLLQTHIYHGIISYKNEDITQRHQGWRPTAKQESELMEIYKFTPDTIVTFVSTGYGGVSYTVDRRPSTCCPWGPCGSCAIHPAASGTAPTVYLAGTKLLQTHIYHGIISYKNEDITQRHQGWRPTAKQESELMEIYKFTPNTIVTFVSTGYGGVSYTV